MVCIGYCVEERHRRHYTVMSCQRLCLPWPFSNGCTQFCDPLHLCIFTSQSDAKEDGPLQLSVCSVSSPLLWESTQTQKHLTRWKRFIWFTSSPDPLWMEFMKQTSRGTRLAGSFSHSLTDSHLVSLLIQSRTACLRAVLSIVGGALLHQ